MKRSGALLVLLVSVVTLHHLAHFGLPPPPQSSNKRSLGVANHTQPRNECNENNNNQTAAQQQPVPSNPYRIVQIGSPRSGSTFQYQLILSIVNLKTKNKNQQDGPPPVLAGMLNEQKQLEKVLDRLQTAIESNQSFVFKTHLHLGRTFQELVKQGTLTVFTSGSMSSLPYSRYAQGPTKLKRECSTAQVKQYQSLFELTDIEVAQLEQHMELYSVLQQCCSMLMSRTEIRRLHGCYDSNDATTASRRPPPIGYPNCEAYNLTQVEWEFATSPIPFLQHNPRKNWQRPGDCQRYRQRLVQEHMGFLRKFPGCDKAMMP